MLRVFHFAVILSLSAIGAQAQPALLEMVARQADEFQREAVQIFSVETLHETSFRYPPHGRIVLGAAALPVLPRFYDLEVVSEYGVGPLKGTATTDLVEWRQILSLNGRSVQTPATARRRLSENTRRGEDRLRKQSLEEFTRLGLVDVATDYGLLLLAFTSEGQRSLQIRKSVDEFVGTDEATRFEWAQTTGGAIEFRGRTTSRRVLQGSLWVRKTDGLPLRISAWFEHREPRHVLRDEASVEYAASRLGFPVPVTVVHRHFVDGTGLTENLYSYAPFRLFSGETTIRYGEALERPSKK